MNVWEWVTAQRRMMSGAMESQNVKYTARDNRTCVIERQNRDPGFEKHTTTTIPI